MFKLLFVLVNGKILNFSVNKFVIKWIIRSWDFYYFNIKLMNIEKEWNFKLSNKEILNFCSI